MGRGARRAQNENADWGKTSFDGKDQNEDYRGQGRGTNPGPRKSYGRGNKRMREGNDFG